MMSSAPTALGNIRMSAAWLPSWQLVQRGIAQGSGAFVAGRKCLVQNPRSAGGDYAPRISRAYLALAHDRPGLEDILATTPMPCCLYAGEIDPI